MHTNRVGCNGKFERDVRPKEKHLYFRSVADNDLRKSETGIQHIAKLQMRLIVIRPLDLIVIWSTLISLFILMV